MALIILMCAIGLQVVFSAFDINPIVAFDREYPVLGKAITLNSLLDLQWHLLVIIGLLPVGLVWALGRHVRVDFIYNKMSTRGQARVNLLGNLVFAAPFFVLMLPAAWTFMMRAWASDEGSASGGLNDLWLIKAVLPLGLGLLALAIVVETIRLVRQIR
ncbi:MAG: TRAP transporter small permease subunit [Pseudomonadota bacterium]